MSKSSQNLKAALRQSGYVETAPACGDCIWSSDEPHGLFCRGHLVLVHDNGRCNKWTPAEHWLKANPLVAPRYITSPDIDVALSPAELAYADKAHALPKPASRG